MPQPLRRVGQKRESVTMTHRRSKILFAIQQALPKDEVTDVNIRKALKERKHKVKRKPSREAFKIRG